MLTAAVRDLHQAAPGRFQTDVRTSAPALWENNPHLTRLHEAEPGVQMLEMHYPLIHQSNQRPYHFLHGYVQFLEERLGLRIPVTRFSGDVHLTPAEKEAPPPGVKAGVPEHFWIVVAGGKQDFTAKWWNPESYQAVVDHFRGRLTFVQCGEEGHWHPRLRNVVDLVGRTSTREFIRLMYHAAGVLCPVTFAMHLAAAVETKPGHPKHRPCVVVAGGREPPHWEAYPHHQFLSTNGALPCCSEGGCWKSRCQLVGDGDEKDRNNLCEQPVQVRPDLRIPRCMTLITPADVCRRIELYYEGKALRVSPPPPASAPLSRLLVDGNPTPLGADYTLRWVDQPDSEAQPVLYHRGKRITRAWSLDLSTQCPADAHGGNANTE
jgi:ADP-heptose:LPS heptosyltransferase